MGDFISEKGGLNITWKIENIDCLNNSTYVSSPKFEIGPFRQTKWTIKILKMGLYGNLYLTRETDNSNMNGPLVITIESSVTVWDSLGKKTLFNNNHKTISFNLQNQIELCFYLSKELEDFSIDNITIFNINLRDISDFDSTVHRFFFQSFIEVEHRKGKFIIPPFDSIFTKQNELHFQLLPNFVDSIPFKIKTLEIEKEKIEIEIEKINKIFDAPMGLLCKLCFENIRQKRIWAAHHRHVFLPNKECVWNFPSSFEYSSLSNHLIRKKDHLYLKFELLICEQKQRTWLKKYEVEPCLSNRNIIKTADKEKANLRDDLMCLYVEQKCPDVEIRVGDKKFPAHKTILSARSPVFSAMFENDMLEKKSSTVEISDIDAETVDRMLFFMYSEILSDQDWSCVVNLYKASDKYQIITLKEKCSDIIREQLATYNACDALLLADKYHDKELLSSVQDYIVTHAKSIINGEKWEMIMESQPKLACQIMYRICKKTD